MVDKKTWEEFRNAGLLWWINMILHTFGWAIVVDLDMETGKISDCYPARIKFRGFDENSNSNGYIKVTKFMNENAEELYKEAIE